MEVKTLGTIDAIFAKIDSLSPSPPNNVEFCALCQHYHVVTVWFYQHWRGGEGTFGFHCSLTSLISKQFCLFVIAYPSLFLFLSSFSFLRGPVCLLFCLNQVFYRSRSDKDPALLCCLLLWFGSS